MKLRARIEGSKVHRVGYRMFLANKAIDLDLPGLSAQNKIEDGRQVVLAFFDGDESQVGEFRRFIEAEGHRKQRYHRSLSRTTRARSEIPCSFTRR